MIRRPVKDFVPKRQVALALGKGRSAVAGLADGPRKYERAAVPTSFLPFEPLVRQLLGQHPLLDAVQVLLESLLPGSRKARTIKR